jgi:hypothetical protein
MKRSKTHQNLQRAGMASVLLSAALLPQVAKAQNANVTFGTATDLNSFNRVNSANAASTSFTHSETAGVNGGGGLTYAGGAVDTTAIYTGSSFDLSSGATLTLGLDFKTTATVPFSGSANAVVMLGVVGDSTFGFYNLANTDFIGGRLRRVSSSNLTGLQGQSKTLAANATSSPADGALAGITFTANEWYRLSFTLTRSAVVNTFDYTMTLQDIGADGLGAPGSVVNGSITGSFVNADMYNDSSVYAAFRGVPTVGNSPGNFDNFTASIPEPSAFAFLGLGALSLVFSKRRAA